MIIYGSRSTNLRNQNIAGQCRSCGTSNSLQLSVFQKYAHVFWIPMFPIGRVYVTQCNHCRNVLEGNEVKHYYRDAYNEISQQVRIPVWTFAGLVLVILGITSLIVSDKQKDKESLARIHSPQQGDVYEYKTEEGQYSLLKVASVEGDTIRVYPNNYASDKITGLSKVRNLGDTSYSEVTFSILKQELLKMHSENKIIDVVRK